MDKYHQDILGVIACNDIIHEVNKRLYSLHIEFDSENENVITFVDGSLSFEHIYYPVDEKIPWRVTRGSFEDIWMFSTWCVNGHHQKWRDKFYFSAEVLEDIPALTDFIYWELVDLANTEVDIYNTNGSRERIECECYR